MPEDDHLMTDSKPAPEGFIDTEELLKRVPVSPGTLRNWRNSGKIPYIRISGRRIIYDWNSVRETLIRRQN